MVMNLLDNLFLEKEPDMVFGKEKKENNLIHIKDFT